MNHYDLQRVNVPERRVSRLRACGPPLDMTAGRFGALRRQSAATPGEGLHSNVSSFAGCALRVWFVKVNAPIGRDVSTAGLRPSARHDSKSVQNNCELCIVHCELFCHPELVEGSRELDKRDPITNRTGECPVMSRPIDYAPTVLRSR